MSARAVICAAVLACTCACAKRVDLAPADATELISSGRAVNPGGVKANIGSPVQVELTFKDGTPTCVMLGAVQLSRDSAHRWVWLEATAGCPQWLAGRWWAELASGPSGWFVQSLSTQAVEKRGEPRAEAKAQHERPAAGEAR